MANSRIGYNVATPIGAEVATLAAEVVQAQQHITRIIASMNAMIDWGSPISYAQIETELGMASGQGSILWNLLTPIQTALNTANSTIGQIDQGVQL
jgi:hypothetical protein